MSEVSKRLQESLDKQAMSAYHLAQKSGVTEASISRILNKGVVPQRKTAEKLARALKISPVWLLTGNGTNKVVVEEDYNPYDLIDQVVSHPRGVDAIVKFLAENHEDLKRHSLYDLFIKGIKSEIRNEIKVEEILKIIERNQAKR